jgi:hypothetical protein
MRIDAKRGLLRAWVVFAVAWISVMGWSEYKSGWAQFPLVENEKSVDLSSVPTEQLVTVLAKYLHFDLDGARKAGYSDQEIADHLVATMPSRPKSSRVADIWANMKSSLPVILLPPFALLVAGYIIVWVVNGFRPRTNP